MNLKAALLATEAAGAFLLFPGCGGGGGSDNSQSQAGTASSGSDTPAQYVVIDLGYGYGVAIGDGEQAGGSFLWHGSAASVVNLYPGGWDSTHVNATSGGIQVGAGQHD